MVGKYLKVEQGYEKLPRLPPNPHTAVVIIIVIIVVVIIIIVVVTTTIISTAMRVKLSPVFFCLSDCFSTLEFFQPSLITSCKSVAKVGPNLVQEDFPPHDGTMSS